MEGAGAHPMLTLAAVWAHVFVFNLAQLWAFARFDFVSMYTVCLVYYLIWQGRGHLRLQVLW